MLHILTFLRFGEVVQTLPQGMTVDIWRMFVQHIKENHVTEENTGHILFILDIYLSHDVLSRNDIMPCNKINKPLVVYRFNNVT